MKAFVLCAVLVAAGSVLASAQDTANPPKFVAANVVADINKCPIKNVLFNKKVFDVTEMAGMLDILQKAGVSETCQNEAASLGSCAADGGNNPDLSSLAVQTGCCSKDCADGIKAAVKSGCQDQYIKAICSKQEYIDKYGVGLISLGLRCVNYTSSCPGMKMPPALAGLGGVAGMKNATAANATTANTTADATASPAPTADTTASPAPEATASPSPAPPKSSASAAVSSAAAVALAAGAALLAL